MPASRLPAFPFRHFPALAAILVSAGCASWMPGAPDIDPVALEQINRMRSVMERFGTYQLTLQTVEDEALASGQLVQVGQTGVIKVARPDHLSIAMERDTGEKWSGWVDDTTVTLVDESKGFYSLLQPKPPLDKALDELGDQYGLELPLIDLISNLRRASLLDHVQSGIYLGTEPVAGAKCHHLLFRQPSVDWQIWIQKEDPALPRKILLTFKEEPGSPIYQTTITEWNLEPKFTARDWKARWLENARQVEIAELLGREESP